MRPWAWLRRSLLTGMLVLAPLAVTLWVFTTVLDMIDGWLRPVLRRVPWLGERMPDSGFTGVGLLAVILLVALVGFIANKGLGRVLLGGVDRLMSRIPMLKAIYASVKELGEVLFSEQRAAFRTVVLFEYPSAGTYSLGFVTHELSPAGDAEGAVTVFLPTTPNPTTGFVLIMKREDVLELPLSTQEGLKLVMSGGSVVSVAGRDHIDQAVRALRERLRALPAR